MPNFKIMKCDTNTAHHPGYFHEQEKNRDWLIMCFQTSFSYYRNGEMKDGKAGDCLINSPNIYIKHGPADDMKTGFQNDWMYFSCDGIEELLNKYGLPIDTHFSIGTPDFMTKSIQEIMYENLNRQSHYKEKISCIVHNLFLDLSRCISRDCFVCHGGDIFLEMRNEIFNSLDENWNLEAMAKRAGYSVSRFSYLYKSRFNISPSSDLLKMRIQKAKNLLSYSDFPIGEISHKSGFSSVQHFSYAFKKALGVSPTEYRNKNSFFRD